MARRSQMMRVATASAFALLLVASMALTGCTQKKEPAKTGGAESGKPVPIKIGVLPTEDSLPLWVAEDKGYFKDAGLDNVEIVVFQSAQERDAAFTAGSIDAFMGDIVAAANLEAAGSGGTILTVMLGADPSQGRFAVVAAPNNPTQRFFKTGQPASLKTLEKPLKVGTSSATIQEYVLDGLAAEAGVSDKISKEEVKKVPVRFELLMQGKLEAAALPEPFISLAEQGGSAVLADDIKSAKNLSQTILFVSDAYLTERGGTASDDALLEAWDRAVADINADPDAYRPMLVEKARLPKPLESSYKVNTYPESQLPSKADVDAVLTWMRDKGYLKGDVTYNDLTVVAPKK